MATNGQVARVSDGARDLETRPRRRGVSSAKVLEEKEMVAKATVLPVENYLGDVLDRAERLQHLIHALELRVRPIMTPDDMDEGCAGVDPDYSPMCEVAERLRTICNRLDMSVVQINYILDHLEL